MKNEAYAIIVSYNPGNEFLDVITSLSNQNINIVIIDNGSTDISYNIAEFFTQNKDENISIRRLSKNIGLAKAQNIGIREILEIEKGKKEFIFFFDQDTIVPVDYVKKMINAYNTYEQANPSVKIGILAPNYLDKNIGDFAHFAELTSNSYRDKSFKRERFLEVSFVISSGSMMTIEVLRKNGRFMNEFFIDQIDTEYCLRNLSNGYKVIATSDVLLKHTIGNRQKKQFLFLTIKPNYHSALRKYFIFRNGVITMQKYKSEFPGFKVLMLKRFIHDFLGVVLYEDSKWEKIKAMHRGLKEGFKANYDEYI